MKIEFTLHAWDEFNYWVRYDNAKVEKINELIRSISQNPFKGLGNPEPLRHEFQGFWSRRIDFEHRLIYRVTGVKGEDQKIQIIHCRFHYRRE